MCLSALVHDLLGHGLMRGLILDPHGGVALGQCADHLVALVSLRVEVDHAFHFEEGACGAACQLMNGRAGGVAAADLHLHCMRGDLPLGDFQAQQGPLAIAGLMAGAEAVANAMAVNFSEGEDLGLGGIFRLAAVGDCGDGAGVVIGDGFVGCASSECCNSESEEKLFHFELY